MVKENWIECPFEKLISTVSSGFACAKRNEVSKETAGSYPHLRPNNVGYFGQMNLEKIVYIPEHLVDNKKKFLPKDSILFNNTNSIELVGRCIYIQDQVNYAYSNHLTCIELNTSAKPWAEYISRYIDFLWHKGFFSNSCKKWVGQAGIGQNILKQIIIPLPPCPEQRRIVERIERLFERIDRAKKLVQAVLDSSETRKAAILHKAFSGKLTAKWREENGVGMESWKCVELGECIKKIEAGKSFKCIERPPENGEVGVVKVSAVSWGIFQPHESKTCMSNEQVNEAYIIKDGDFLFSRANTIQLVGACVIVDNIRMRLMLSDKILRFIFNSSCQSEYIMYYLRSKSGRDQIESLSSGNQDSMRNVSQNSIKKIVIKLPTILEQYEIVRIINGLYLNEQRAHKLYDVVDKIDIMKKSILAHAFRGELGTNNHKEESALCLLKEM